MRDDKHYSSGTPRSPPENRESPEMPQTGVWMEVKVRVNHWSRQRVNAHNTGLQRNFLNEMLIISIVWHVESSNSMRQGHDKPEWPFKLPLNSICYPPSQRQAHASEYLPEDRSAEILVLLRWPFRHHRFKSEDLHRGVRRRSWPFLSSLRIRYYPFWGLHR